MKCIVHILLTIRPSTGSGLFSLRNFVLSAVVSLLKNRLHFDEHLKLTKMQTQKNDNERANERVSKRANNDGSSKMKATAFIVCAFDELFYAEIKCSA